MSALDVQFARENKAAVERDTVDILEGRATIKSGKDEPSEYRPEVPDWAKGVLLHGMQRIEDRPSETREQCLARHDVLRRGNIIAKDAPTRWFNPDTREMEII